MTTTPLEQAKEVQGWKTMGEHEMSSTIAYFIGGFKRRNQKISIWEGVSNIDPETGDEVVSLETDDEQPEWANYLIQATRDGELLELADNKFAETKVGAWIKAKRLTDDVGNISPKAEWIQAARNDGYAEYELETGDILVTDWEGNNKFAPYVVPVESEEDSRDVEAEIQNAIIKELGFKPNIVEWGYNGTYVIHSSKP